MRTERSLAWQKAKQEAIKMSQNKEISHKSPDNFKKRLLATFHFSKARKQPDDTAHPTLPTYVAPPGAPSANMTSANEWNSLAKRTTTRRSISKAATYNGREIKVGSCIYWNDLPYLSFEVSSTDVRRFAFTLSFRGSKTAA